MPNATLSITIPEEYVDLAIESFTNMAGANISINPELNELAGGAGASFSYAERQPGELLKPFGERVLFELARAFVKAYFQNKKTALYATEINAIPRPEHGIPDGIIQPGAI